MGEKLKPCDFFKYTSLLLNEANFKDKERGIIELRELEKLLVEKTPIHPIVSNSGQILSDCSFNWILRYSRIWELKALVKTWPRRLQSWRKATEETRRKDQSDSASPSDPSAEHN
ncbi:Oidioi.mRNA.OKI2018_I69.XSR.g16811.t1.cds [Oikopleura dioica]|uniref:Oidioi.mRNA.OKI2018_I69.XSR.g16811.t1.cds n=1 Tax=Oikopleura dioica TaxID=34765 RepID=A0ABN7SNL8_OIKDI|nr:Oidioi.mRNA.OKI2018_I69.XSR.g16811.t1.cds [Oikopleura dioica]